jgi:protein phosphatase
MRIAETAAVSDPGRTRRRNEDAYALEPPLFAVADGMGGAQAGEVASRLAVAAFRDFHAADELEPEARVAAIVAEANRRIHERAVSDVTVSGMGTTITAALLDRDTIVVGHVGDSRAYLLREGTLEQLTEDHSLVADLLRSGQLTPEEAETHPQRSVITRALGTDPDVDVDTFTIQAAAGDLLLLCSDGLTTMLGDDEIAAAVQEQGKLKASAKALVRAANRRGGEDNITVVLVRLAGDEEETAENAAPDDEPTAESLEDTLSGLVAPVGAAPEAAKPLSADRPRRLSWGRGFLVLLAGVAVALGVVAAALWGVSRANFVGVDDTGRITVYQGLPWDLGGGVKLYRERYVSQVRAIQLSPEERAELLDHDLVGYDRARAEVARYEKEAVPPSQ